MGNVLYLRYLRSFSSSASLQASFKPLAAMPCPNSRLSSMLFLGLLDTSKIGSISFTPVACITGDIFSLFLRRAKARRKQATRARHMRLWKALLARFALAFARLKTRKNNARYAGYHSWAKIKGGIYYEKNYISQQAKREGLLC